MDYPRLTICFLFILSLITPQPIFAADVSCSDSGNYTTNSTYATNLKTLLSSISNSSDLNSDGFFNASFGQNADQVYALALCRGDQEITSCRSCLNDSSQAITKECPNQKEAFLGKDECMLRFSNRNILGSMDDGYVAMGYNVNNATDPAQFTKLLGNLLFNLREQAASGVVQKYAAAVVNYTSLTKIYGLAQCTPDISKLDCGKCLDAAMNEIPRYASGKVGAGIVRYSCVLRFETYQFFQLAVDAPPPPRSTPAPPTPPPPTPQPPPDTPGTLRASLFHVYTVSTMAWKYWREGAGSNIIDPVLRANSGSIRDITRCIHIGLLCIQENVASRPTMASVVLMLNSFSITLALPSEPAFFMHSSIDPELPLLREYSSGAKDSGQSTSKSAHFSENEASISELHPR
ncbi:hypothetical protein RJ639_027067 [Escallonia herrerae]|uniref:Gnk2-homologous domain-containing protein n=1 Tax=Escallonia herrerae TaxID=1293975 RepID=A0AA88X4F1_9ASTE|nr:hypothetical protein RJ639_027067 [Escallonia herrerae]